MKVYEIITERILEKLEQGSIPWHQPWSAELPKNLVSKREYRGINVFLLGSQSYAQPWWLTYKQAHELGGHVRKGERSIPVVFWKWLERERSGDSGESETVQIPLLRYYSVFNVEQCEGIPEGKVPPLTEREFEAIEQAEQIVSGMPQRPQLQHRRAQAYYKPAKDLVNMPKPELFQSSEEYFSVLFHELTHATGHPSRLHRFDTEELAPFGSPDYSQEELVAEMGAAFLCGHCHIEQKTLENSAAYLQGWLRKLRDDKRLVIVAAAQAQKAADFILSRSGSGEEQA